MRGKLAIGAAAFVTAAIWPAASSAQDSTGPQVEIVQTVGCAEQRSDDGVTWWLTCAAEPAEIGPGPFEQPQVDAARSQETGSREFQLIGFAEFVDPATLLQWADRALFTSEEQVNATNSLRQGSFVLVKGLLVDVDGSARINLLSVVGLADACE
ncbi:MAG: hypothetical protein F4Y57_02220 [Acidobacteria bacterium]|nr:hypothetical protein [Acidobacteriota bacterium]